MHFNVSFNCFYAALPDLTLTLASDKQTGGHSFLMYEHDTEPQFQWQWHMTNGQCDRQHLNWEFLISVQIIKAIILNG